MSDRNWELRVWVSLTRLLPWMWWPYANRIRTSNMSKVVKVVIGLLEISVVCFGGWVVVRSYLSPDMVEFIPR